MKTPFTSVKRPLTITQTHGDASHRVWAKRSLSERIGMALHRAAPELLEALVAARTTIRRAANTARTVSSQRDFNAKADILDAVIAKAKGGAA